MGHVISSLYEFSDSNKVGRVRGRHLKETNDGVFSGIIKPTFRENECERFQIYSQLRPYHWEITVDVTNDNCQNIEDYLSVGVTLKSTNGNIVAVDAWISLTLYTKSSNKTYSWCSAKSHIFIKDNIEWCFQRLIKTNQLWNIRDPQFLEWELRFEPRVKSVYPITKNNFKIPELHIDESSVRASVDFEELLKNENLSDIKLISSDDREFRVHRVILAARSSYFDALFRNDVTIEQSELRLEGITGEVLEQMIFFMYTCRLEKLEDMAEELLAASDKYLLDDLKEVCEECLKERINLNNAIEMLIFSDTYSAENLKAKILDMISKCCKTVIGPKDLEKLSSNPDLMGSIIKAISSQKLID